MEKLAVGQTLSPSIIKAFRLELQRLGVGLEIVSSKNPETKLLWKKMALGQTKEGGIVHGFFRFSPGMSAKFEQLLKGPFVYLLEETTTYTIAHELTHIKLWHKMTKEFPELAQTFQKLSKRLHEEHALSELVKQGKWPEADLLKDLETINDLREAENLPRVGLEYYKSWKLVNYIK